MSIGRSHDVRILLLSILLTTTLVPSTPPCFPTSFSPPLRYPLLPSPHFLPIFPFYVHSPSLRPSVPPQLSLHLQHKAQASESRSRAKTKLGSRNAMLRRAVVLWRLSALKLTMTRGSENERPAARYHLVEALMRYAVGTYCLGMAEQWPGFVQSSKDQLLALPDVTEEAWFQRDNDGDEGGNDGDEGGGVGGSGGGSGSGNGGGSGSGKDGKGGKGGKGGKRSRKKRQFLPPHSVVHSKDAVHSSLVHALGVCQELVDMGMFCQRYQLDVGQTALRYSATAGDAFHKLGMSALVAAVLNSDEVRVRWRAVGRWGGVMGRGWGWGRRMRKMRRMSGIRLSGREVRCVR